MPYAIVKKEREIISGVLVATIPTFQFESWDFATLQEAVDRRNTWDRPDQYIIIEYW